MIHDKEIMLKNIKEIRDILQKYTNNWWIDCGTLLGFRRDGNFIDGDLDTDIGIFAEDFDLRMLEDFSRADFKIGNVFGIDGKGREISLVKENVKTDIYFYYKQDDFRWLAMWNNGGKVKEDIIPMKFKSNIIEEIESQEYLGEKWNVPKNTEEYLITRYGDWKTPEPGFHWATSPKNIDRGLKIW